MDKIEPWFADIFHFLIASTFPQEASKSYKYKIQSDANYFVWDDPYLWRFYSDKIIRKCIPDHKIQLVLQFCHSAFGGGYYGSSQMAQKVLDCGFGVLKTLVSDQGSHFYNKTMSTLLKKYGVVHQVATAYHPQTNNQAEVFNREITKLLQKMANPSRNDWNRLLEDTLSNSIRNISLSNSLRFHISVGVIPQGIARGRIWRTKLQFGPYRLIFSVSIVQLRLSSSPLDHPSRYRVITSGAELEEVENNWFHLINHVRQHGATVGEHGRRGTMCSTVVGRSRRVGTQHFETAQMFHELLIL
ncbi:hypothetical protein CR513_03865, partial [Mucuna pruriens]